MKFYTNITHYIFHLLEYQEIKDKLPIFANEFFLYHFSKQKKWDIHWFVIKNEDKTIAAVPFAIKHLKNFKKGMFITSLLYLDKECKKFEKDILNELVKKIKEENLCDWIQQPPNWALFNDVPANAISIPFGSYRIDLRHDEAEIFSKIHGKHKNAIRMAEKLGINIEFLCEVPLQVYNLIKNTLARSGMKLESYDYFDSLPPKFKQENLLVAFATHEEKMQTCAIIYFNEYAGYYMYGGSIENPKPGSGNLLQWSIIKRLKTMGVHYYDFLGARLSLEPNSKIEGIQRFKSRFGGEFINGYLWKSIINKKKYFIYKSLIRILNVVMGKQFKGDLIDKINYS